MLSIVRLTVLSLLICSAYQPILASSSRNNSNDVVEDYKSIRRPSLSLESSEIFNFVPTGSVISFAGTIAPQGWLLCDGQQCSSQKYPQLYSVVGERYIPQDSWIHQANKHAQLEKFFCVPDMRGRTSVGVDDKANRVTTNNTLGASSGEEKHLLTIAEMPSHSHSIQFMKPGGAFNVHPDGAKLVVMPKTANDQGVEKASLNATGQDQPHNNMQPYLVLNYIIKTGQEESDNHRHRTAQRETELDTQRTRIAQLEQELNNLKMASAKAWVVFNGTNATVLDSYNIASVVRNDTGLYTINFSKPFGSKDYCFSLNAGDGGGNCPHATGPYASQPTRTSFKFITLNFPGKQFDAPFISACFYGKQ